MGISNKTRMPRTIINWPEVIAEVERFVSSSAESKAALERLLIEGCDRELILRKLFMYCGGSRQDVLAAKRDFRWKRDFILKLTDRLERVVPDIKQAEQILEDAGISVSSGEAEGIESYAGLLRGLEHAILADAASGRLTGRDEHLKFLSEMVAIITGRPHYKELAALIAAVQLGYTGDPGQRIADHIGRLARKKLALDFESVIELERLRAASQSKSAPPLAR